MEIYNRRIGFLISDQHFITHGGIGQFAKGFTEMCKTLNWKVDIILDKSPTSAFSDVVKSMGASIVYPEDALRYSDHTSTFQFSDTINFEKMVNFRKSILHAFSKNLYDMLVCNTQEAMSAAYAMGISRYIPVVFYTHSHSMIYREEESLHADAFLDVFHNFYNKHMEFPDIIIGTQSQKNYNELKKNGAVNCVILPMPMSERGLLEPNYEEREGVLFIGRWEDRKNPEPFLKIIKETGLPARVMTNSNGAKKFEARFKELGITNYTIKAGIVGQEKVDFIKGSKVHFNPAPYENYPFAFFECLGHVPCVVLDNQEWSTGFDSKYYTKVTMSDAARCITEKYNITTKEHYASGSLDYVKQLDQSTAQLWLDFLNNFESRKSKSNSAKINSYNMVKYSDFIVGLNRSHLAREDFESVLNNRHKFTVKYTDKDTFLSKDKNFTPPKDDGLSALFEGL